MLTLRKIADLEMSAASAMVTNGPVAHVVADDAITLDTYVIESGRRTLRIPLLERPGSIPAGVWGA